MDADTKRRLLEFSRMSTEELVAAAKRATPPEIAPPEAPISQIEFDLWRRLATDPPPLPPVPRSMEDTIAAARAAPQGGSPKPASSPMARIFRDSLRHAGRAALAMLFPAVALGCGFALFWRLTDPSTADLISLAGFGVFATALSVITSIRR